MASNNMSINVSNASPITEQALANQQSMTHTFPTAITSTDMADSTTRQAAPQMQPTPPFSSPEMSGALPSSETSGQPADEDSRVNPLSGVSSEDMSCAIALMELSMFPRVFNGETSQGQTTKAPATQTDAGAPLIGFTPPFSVNPSPETSAAFPAPSESPMLATDEESLQRLAKRQGARTQLPNEPLKTNAVNAPGQSARTTDNTCQQDDVWAANILMDMRKADDRLKDERLRQERLAASFNAGSSAASNKRKRENTQEKASTSTSTSPPSKPVDGYETDATLDLPIDSLEYRRYTQPARTRPVIKLRLSPRVEDPTPQEDKGDEEDEKDEEEPEQKVEMGGQGSGRRKREESNESNQVLEQRKGKGKCPKLKTPAYHGPPEYLLDSNRTDHFANPANIVLDEDGTFRPKEGARTLKVNTMGAAFITLPPTSITKTDLLRTDITTNTDNAKMDPDYASKYHKYEHGEPSQNPDPPLSPKYNEWHYSNAYAQAGLNQQNNVRKDFEAFRRQRDRNRSPTPSFDDHPVPDIDDMNVHPQYNTYTTKKSRKQTNKTPAEYEQDRQDFIKRRDARRERDDWEMYNGLRKFNGRQRGWNGQHEADRRLAEQERHEQDQHDHTLRDKEIMLIDPSLRPSISPITARELEHAFEDHQSSYAIAAIGLEDQVCLEEDHNHREMVKTRFDTDAVRQAALEEQHRQYMERIRLEEYERARHSQKMRSYASDTVTEISSPKPPPRIRIRINNPSKGIPPARKRTMSRRRSDEEENLESNLSAFDHPANREIRKPRKHSRQEVVMNEVVDNMVNEI